MMPKTTSHLNSPNPSAGNYYYHAIQQNSSLVVRHCVLVKCTKFGCHRSRSMVTGTGTTPPGMGRPHERFGQFFDICVQCIKTTKKNSIKSINHQSSSDQWKSGSLVSLVYFSMKINCLLPYHYFKLSGASAEAEDTNYSSPKGLSAVSPVCSPNNSPFSSPKSSHNDPMVKPGHDQSSAFYV